MLQRRMSYLSDSTISGLHNRMWIVTKTYFSVNYSTYFVIFTGRFCSKTIVLCRCTLFCLQMISTIFGWRRQRNCCLFHLEDVINFEVGTSSKLMSFELLVYQSLDQKIRGILQEIGLHDAQIMSICRFSKMSKLHFPLNFCCKLQICTYYSMKFARTKAHEFTLRASILFSQKYVR